MTSAPVALVLSRLEGVKKVGAGFVARCPVHPDRDPSLGVDEGDDGRALVICRAGCDTAAVLAELKLDAGDLFMPNNGNGQGHGSTIADTYDYTDEAGDLLYQVVRMAPKAFRQRRPDGNGGWEWSTKGVRKVLYNLPDVLDAVAQGVPIYIVEGEKDAEALARAGCVATCNAGGAGKWRTEYAEVLKGADVIIVPDQDPPGIKHAGDVEASLVGVARTVQVVRPAVGKDAADHLGAGKTVEEFVSTDEGVAAPGDPVDAAIVDWSTFWSDDTGGDWLVEPILPAGRQVAMFASAKVGKSLLALEVAAALATGRAVLDQPAGPAQRVVYLDWEQAADDLRERLVDFGYGPEVDLANLVYYLLPNLPALDTKAGGEVMAGILSRWAPAAVVIDTMARAVEGLENESDTLRAFYRHTGSRIKVAGVSLLRLDHAGKDPAKGQRGTSAKTEDVDVVWRLTADGTRVELRRTHSRVPWVPERVVLARREEPHLEHRRLAEEGWLFGTADVAADLDTLAVPLDATIKTALAALKKDGRGRRREVVADALKYRRVRP